MTAHDPLAALLLAGSSLAVAAGLIALAAWVAVRERWRAIGLQLAALGLLAATWLGAAGFMLATPDETVAIRWSRASYLGIALLPAALYQFTARLLCKHRQRQRTLSLLWVASWIVAGLAQATPWIVAGVERHPWGHYTRLASPAIVIVALYIVAELGVLSLFAGELADAENGPYRWRLSAFASALAVGSLGAVDFLPSFGWSLPPLGMLPVAAGAVLAVRAVRRYQLVDVTANFSADRILETLQSAVLVSDLDERVRVANTAACELLGHSRDELVGMRISDVIASPHNVGTASDTLMRGDSVRGRPMVWRRADREHVEVEASVSMVRDEIGAPVGMVYVAGGIDDRERAAQIEYQAFHDSLTGLPNRTAFNSLLETRLAAIGTRRRHLAVLFLDLDGFKVINDSLGHSVGDRVLQVLGRRLRGCVREGDLVSRFGGDEFTLLVDLAKPEDAEIVAHKLLETVAEPYILDGETLYVTGSVGVALHPAHGSDPESLVRNADAAMYAAKELGRSNYQVCGQGLPERARERLRIEARLRQAIEADELELHYQPVIELATGLVVGVEALLRWNHDGELLLPERFLAIAEQSMLARPLGDWVLRTACMQAMQWQQRFGSFRMSVNLSTHQLVERGLVEQVANLLDETGLPPHRLELEITESTAMKDPERTRELLARLRALGVGIALDDFGTGYSSLSYLQQFPLDTVKIDRSFVSSLGEARGGLAIVRATMAMAQALGLRVVAEGVETAVQLELLRELGCHYAQGFGLGAPMPSEKLERSVHRSGRRRDTGERPMLTLHDGETPN